ncbi:hypothetical protein ABEB36_002723 [Hypothenemus hampei]|uniref:Cytochrome P450 n=1 Tax=Hypothenemus hampei TaxID=57062 RepID=A0ABD1FAF2_HYPHA
MLSPGFTSGKMKTLFHLIEQVNERLLTYLDLKPDIATGQTLETQNLCRRFTLDNVALSAFGIDGQSFENDESDFMKLATSFIAPGTFALSMLQTFPLASRLISLKVIPKKVEEALIQIVSDVLDHRNKSDIVANDFLQFISELGEKHQLNYAEITGHAATFFEDGYETSALVISYVLFNLSRHPEIQQRLRSEILHTEKTSVTGKITYEHLGTMSYLNACIYESMRLCPVLEHFTRVCKRPYTYKTANESPAHLKRMTVKIDVGTVCIIPFGGFCHDRHYFEDPKEYKPERFLNDNSSIKNVFHPFGGGHRICLGQRFGIMQVRMGVIQIIKNFQVSLSSQTKLPFEFLPWTILNKVKHGVWLIYKKIQY